MEEEYTETIEALIGKPLTLSRLLERVRAEYPAVIPYENIHIYYLGTSATIKGAHEFAILPSTSTKNSIGKFRKEKNGDMQYSKALLNSNSGFRTFDEWKPILIINSRPALSRNPFTNHSTQAAWGGKRKYKRTRRGKRRSTRKR
jgi:hypothetical protein